MERSIHARAHARIHVTVWLQPSNRMPNPLFRLMFRGWKAFQPVPTGSNRPPEPCLARRSRVTVPWLASHQVRTSRSARASVRRRRGRAAFLPQQGRGRVTSANGMRRLKRGAGWRMSRGLRAMRSPELRSRKDRAWGAPSAFFVMGGPLGGFGLPVLCPGLLNPAWPPASMRSWPTEDRDYDSPAEFCL